MFNILQEALDSFFKETLGLDIDICQKNEHKWEFVSKIDIIADKIHSVYFMFEFNSLSLISSILLGEDEIDISALNDLSCEIANLVIGSAKVISSEKDIHFNISTPILLNSCDIAILESQKYSVDNGSFMLAINRKI